MRRDHVEITVLLLQLHEEGRVDLHAPVAGYLPWFELRSEYEPIAPHHLLTHTGGIVAGSDVSADSRFDVWAIRETEAGSAPGERFEYSNVGYRALGYLLEEVTGLSFTDWRSHRDGDSFDLSSVRSTLQGGEPMPPSCPDMVNTVWYRLKDVTGPVRISTDECGNWLSSLLPVNIDSIGLFGHHRGANTPFSSVVSRQP